MRRCSGRGRVCRCRRGSRGAKLLSPSRSLPQSRSSLRGAVLVPWPMPIFAPQCPQRLFSLAHTTLSLPSRTTTTVVTSARNSRGRRGGRLPCECAAALAKACRCIRSKASRSRCTSSRTGAAEVCRPAGEMRCALGIARRNRPWKRPAIADGDDVHWPSFPYACCLTTHRSMRRPYVPTSTSNNPLRDPRPDHTRRLPAQEPSLLLQQHPARQKLCRSLHTPPVSVRPAQNLTALPSAHGTRPEHYPPAADPINLREHKVLLVCAHCRFD